MDPRTRRLLELREEKVSPEPKYKLPLIGVSLHVQPWLTQEQKREEKMQEEPQHKYHCEKHGPHNGRQMGKGWSDCCPKCVQEKATQTRAMKLTVEEKVRKHKDANNKWRDRKLKEEIEELSGGAIEAVLGTAVEPILTVDDFKDYPELLERVKELAKEDMRPLSMQILYLCRSAIANAISAKLAGMTRAPVAPERSSSDVAWESRQNETE